MTAARRFLDRMVAPVAYPPDDRDLRTFSVAGLRLPTRATVVTVAVLLIVIFDYQRTFIPDPLIQYDRNPGMQRLQAIERVALFLCVPLLLVLVGFRDRPSRYGLRLGDWRWGLGLALAGCIVMTPIVLAVAPLPEFRDWYAPSAESVGGVALTNVLDLVSSEFFYRGFLMLALARVFGPVAILVQLFPFTMVHLLKPELELLSTAFGGAVYGWLTWRTGSILWGGLAHAYIVTLLIVVAGAAR